MNSKQRQAKHQRRRYHNNELERGLRDILDKIRTKAKRQHKGSKFIVKEMEKAGYLPNGKGGWRRMTKGEQKQYEKNN